MPRIPASIFQPRFPSRSSRSSAVAVLETTFSTYLVANSTLIQLRGSSWGTSFTNP